MRSQHSLELQKKLIVKKTNRFKGPKEINPRNSQSWKINLEFKENRIKKKITRKIKKKKIKPFHNLKKILNVIYRKKKQTKNLRFNGNLKEDVSVLYLIICKFILDNKSLVQTSASNSQSKFKCFLILIYRFF